MIHLRGDVKNRYFAKFITRTTTVMGPASLLDRWMQILGYGPMMNAIFTAVEISHLQLGISAPSCIGLISHTRTHLTPTTPFL